KRSREGRRDERGNPIRKQRAGGSEWASGPAGRGRLGSAAGGFSGSGDAHRHVGSCASRGDAGPAGEGSGAGVARRAVRAGRAALLPQVRPFPAHRRGFLKEPGEPAFSAQGIQGADELNGRELALHLRRAGGPAYRQPDAEDAVGNGRAAAGDRRDVREHSECGLWRCVKLESARSSPGRKRNERGRKRGGAAAGGRFLFRHRGKWRPIGGCPTAARSGGAQSGHPGRLDCGQHRIRRAARWCSQQGGPEVDSLLQRLRKISRMGVYLGSGGGCRRSGRIGAGAYGGLVADGDSAGRGTTNRYATDRNHAAESATVASAFRCRSVSRPEAALQLSRDTHASANRSIAWATPPSSFVPVTCHPSDRISGTLFPITTGTPAKASISRSFRLSPMAITSSREYPWRAAQSRSAAPLETSGWSTST